MARFLHTGDWQLGMSYKHAGDKGVLLRKSRLDTLVRLVTLAEEISVDFIIATGDQFEHNQVDSALVTQVASILSKSKVPIYMIPGNHDPYIRQSVYRHPVWTQTKQVCILNERAPIEVLPNVELYPCPLYEDHGSDDPTSWIPRRDNLNTIRIGVAHGSYLHRSDIDFTDSYPISNRATSEHDLNYLAVGHWHSFQVYDQRVVYSGTHEATKFGESNSGNVLLVEISGPNAEPKITPVRIGNYTWLQLKETIRTENDLDTVLGILNDLPNKASTLVDVTLDGFVSVSLYARLIDENLFNPDFFYHRMDNSVKIAPSTEDIEAMALSGVTKTVMEKLLAEDDPKSKQAVLLLCEHLAKKGVSA